MSEQFDKREILGELMKKVSEPMQESTSVSEELSEEKIIDLGDGFDFEGFQVVRREFFAHTNEPAVSFNNCKFYVNAACLRRFPETNSIQVMVNRDTKILAIMPCPEGSKDSFIWCGMSKGKRSPKQVTCKIFFAMLADMMGWNPDHRYKMLGHLIRANGETLIAFDLTAAEVYQRTFPEGKKPRTSRNPVFPSNWQNQFGLPYSEHKQSVQINIFDGYAVYSIKDAPNKRTTTEEEISVTSPDLIQAPAFSESSSDRR